MQFEVTILGSNGAIHAYNRYPTSQVLVYNGNSFLIDCGEGTQFRMVHFGIKRGRLDNIFISHMHGDHFYGLIGLITSFNLNWREHALNIYGPPGVEEIIKLHLKHANTQLKFEINFHHTSTGKPAVIFEDAALTVETVVLKHRIPTTGFVFKEKPGLRKIIAEKLEQYNIPHHKILDIKRGADFTTESGSVVRNAELTLPPPAPRSYAYCSDTAYHESIVDSIKDVDLLYHEATFINEHAARAEETFHSTGAQAATIAKKAGVKKLIIGHFSARYEQLDQLLAEAREVFPNTELANEGKVFSV